MKIGTCASAYQFLFKRQCVFCLEVGFNRMDEKLPDELVQDCYFHSTK